MRDDGKWGGGGGAFVYKHNSAIKPEGEIRGVLGFGEMGFWEMGV